MTYEDVRLDRDGQVAILTLARPKALNALRAQTVDELNAAIDEIEADRDRQGRRPRRRRQPGLLLGYRPGERPAPATPWRRTRSPSATRRCSSGSGTSTGW